MVFSFAGLLKDDLAGLHTHVTEKHGDISIDGLDSSGLVAFFQEYLFCQLFANLHDDVFISVLFHSYISIIFPTTWVAIALIAICTGRFLFALGQPGPGRWIRFIPHPCERREGRTESTVQLVRPQRSSAQRDIPTADD